MQTQRNTSTTITSVRKKRQHDKLTCRFCPESTPNVTEKVGVETFGLIKALESVKSLLLLNRRLCTTYDEPGARRPRRISKHLIIDTPNSFDLGGMIR